MTDQEWKAVSQLSENLKHNELLHMHIQDRYEATLRDMKRQFIVQCILAVILIANLLITLAN